MKHKLLFALAGVLAGAFGMYAWLSLRPATAGVHGVREASVFSAGSVEVWYQSLGETSEFRNEFRFRKLCGDARKPCTEWSLGATTKSERSYPSKDIEFHAVGENILMSFPDGQAIKGSLSEPWKIESP